MSVGQTSRRAGPYTGTGLVSQYPFTFRIFTETELRVLRSEGEEIDAPDEELAYGTDYTVSLNADQEASPGGTVTLASPLAEGLRLSILSNVPSTQTVTITNYDGMQPRTLNTVHDKLTILIQQLEEQLERTLLIPGSSNETPDQLMQRLLAAQETAQAAADEAVSAKDEAQEILDDVKDYGEAATVLEPVKDDIPTLAEVVDQIETVGNNITAVSVVAGDLDVTFKDAIIRLGDLDNDPDPGQTPEVTGGYIKTLAENIADINEIAENLEDILNLTSEIDKIPGYLEDMDKQVQASSKNAQNALGSANAAANSAQDAATQKNLAKDWAIKLDGKVVEADVEIDFSAKYWANQAKSSADSASATLTQVTQAGKTAVGNVQSAQSTAVQAVNSAGSTQIAAVDGAKDSAIAAVSAQQTTSVNAVNAAGAQQTANAKAQADAAAQSRVR